MSADMNSVTSLKEQPFTARSFEERLQVKSLGRPTPHLNIEQEGRACDRTFKRQFRSTLYDKYSWICGCETQNALFCFPCLLYGGKDIWTGVGITSLAHVNTLAKKHVDGKKHISSVLQLSALGRYSAGSQLTCTRMQEIETHNKQVDKNRYIASRMIDFLKTSRKLDVSNGRCLNLEEILKDLDILLEDCIQQSKLFLEFSRLVQEDLLQCVLDTCRDIIVEELKRTRYVAVILDDTAAVSSSLYVLVIFRYEVDGDLHERYWGLINTEADSPAESLQYVLKELSSVFDTFLNKIIAVSFEGPFMMQTPADTLESKIKEHFPRANYILSYDHNLNTVVENAASCNCSARKFLSCLPVFPAFFSSPQRLRLLETVASNRGIYPPPGGWNFKIQTVVSVYQVQQEILECCLGLENCLCSKTVQEARVLQYLLEDEEFLFWLKFFHKVMQQVESLNTELEAGQVDTWKAVRDFTSVLNELQNEISENCKGFCEETKQQIADRLKRDSQEVCEIVIASVQYHLQARDHQEICKLLDCTCFSHYSKDFPDKLLNTATKLYPDLNKLGLCCELGVIYERADLREIEATLLLLQFLHHCSLEQSFPETTNLLRIIVTLPVPTSEIDRCPGTMRKIKTFLKNSSITEHSATLVMVSFEKKMISSVKDFNKRVLEKLANREAWRLEFNYRK